RPTSPPPAWWPTPTARMPPCSSRATAAACTSAWSGGCELAPATAAADAVAPAPGMAGLPGGIHLGRQRHAASADERAAATPGPVRGATPDPAAGAADGS